MSMRVRDLQQYLGKFTENQKGTAISNCHIYIETHDGHLEDIRRIEIQENNIPYGSWMFFDQIVVFDQIKRCITAVVYSDKTSLKDSSVDLSSKFENFLYSIFEVRYKNQKKVTKEFQIL